MLFFHSGKTIESKRVQSILIGRFSTVLFLILSLSLPGGCHQGNGEYAKDSSALSLLPALFQSSGAADGEGGYEPVQILNPDEPAAASEAGDGTTDDKTNGGSSESEATATTSKSESGIFRLFLTDFPLQGKEIDQVLIHLRTIEIHSESRGWFTLVDFGTAGKSLDLLSLSDGLNAELGSFRLSPDVYTQIRLNLFAENSIVIKEGEKTNSLPLRIPSGQQTGIKIVRSIEIQDGGITTLVLDFDAEKSVSFNKGVGYTLKPVIKVKDYRLEDSTRKLIQANRGGSVEIFGEVGVDIPAGALSQDTEISITPLGEPSIQPFASMRIIGKVYDMGPDGTRFGKDVTVSISYDKATLDRFGIDETSLKIYYFDTKTGLWEEIPGTIDFDRKLVSGTVNHFTVFGVGGGPPSTVPRIHPAAIVYATDGTNMSEVPYRVTATVKADAPASVASATLFYRKIGSTAYETMPLTYLSGDKYEAIFLLSFLRDDVAVTGIEVFVRATNDLSPPEVSCAPLTCDVSPHSYSYNPDLDGDGMNDRWEIENGLDITLDDSALNPDGDSFTNLEEYQNNTDPNVFETTTDAPIILPAAGFYTRVKSVGFTAAPGETIYYTTDGSNPDCAGNGSLYSRVFPVATTTTVKAVVCNGGSVISPVSESLFTVVAPDAPDFSVSGGSYGGPRAVTLSTPYDVEFIFFTTDGIAPTCDGSYGTLYIQPVPVKETTTLQAIACGGGGLVSPVATANYTLPPYAPTVQMGGGRIGSPLDLFGAVTTFAGPKAFPSNGFGSEARFLSPIKVVSDGIYLYVSDMRGYIQRVEISNGAVTNFVGGAIPGSSDGVGGDASFFGSAGITSDGTYLYVAENKSHTIRKIEIPTGKVTTLAGSPGNPGSTDGVGEGARFNQPIGICMDNNYLYVVDRGNSIIRKIEIATATVTTLAGSPGIQGTSDGAVGIATFQVPYGIAMSGGSLYTSDLQSHTIRKIDVDTGEVTTLAGLAGNGGTADGLGSMARFYQPADVAVDGNRLYVADSGNHTIRMVDLSDGSVTTVFGRAGISGSFDGTGTNATFKNPVSIVVEGNYIFSIDSGNHTIRKIDQTTGEVTTLAGSVYTTMQAGETGDGTGFDARFLGTVGFTTDGSFLYITDSPNRTIRRVELATGIVSTIAGSPGVYGATDGTGAAASFALPTGITTDGTSLYITDTNNMTIRKVDIATGNVTTLAGQTGERGTVDGVGSAARFTFPRGITTDGTNLYVADTDNQTIRKIVIGTGLVTTLAGSPGVYGSVDGTGTAARFFNPIGITTDGTYLYIGDIRNYTLRKLELSSGVVTTLAGSPGISGYIDGTGGVARFGSPQHLTTDGVNLYVSDMGNWKVRKIVIGTGQVTTLAGNEMYISTRDGTGSSAFLDPGGITSDGINLYVVGRGVWNIRKIE